MLARKPDGNFPVPPCFVSRMGTRINSPFPGLLGGPHEVIHGALRNVPGRQQASAVIAVGRVDSSRSTVVILVNDVFPI